MRRGHCSDIQGQLDPWSYANRGSHRLSRTGLPRYLPYPHSSGQTGSERRTIPGHAVDPPIVFDHKTDRIAEIEASSLRFRFEEALCRLGRVPAGARQACKRVGGIVRIEMSPEEG